MLAEYIESFENIRIDVNRNRWSLLTRNRAPYKPLLLLTALDLAAQSEIERDLMISV